MLDVHTLANFMISTVTTYFASCGDSLEKILDDTTDSHSTFKVSSSSKETSNFNQHLPDPLVAYSIDGMAICHSIDLDNEGQPFEIQKINGTDMIFFPRPSSEMPYSKKPLIMKKHYHPLSELKGQRSRSDEKVRPVEPGKSSLILQNTNYVSTKNKISQPSEVASKWIAMGLVKENIRNTVPLHHYHNQQLFPFDEIKIENSKRRPPLAIRLQSRLQKQTKMPTPSTMTGGQVESEALAVRNNIHMNEVRSPTSTTTNPGEDNALFLRDDIVIRNFDLSLNNSRDKIHNQKMPSHWKSAVDPRSGQTYFFHEITRETQWRKPMDLATNEERSAMEEKEQKEKDFFAAMEANILSSLSRGVIPGTPAQDKSATSINEEDLKGTSEGEGNPSRIESRHSLRRVRSRAGRPEFMRTISTMDESVLSDVIRRQPSFRSVKSGLSKKEPSLQLEGLNQFLGSRSNHNRDGFDSSCSSSQGSQSSILETLEEDAGESSCSVALDLMPNLRSNVTREQDNDDGSLKTDARLLNQSISTRDDLNWEETQALNKLFSLTKEMIDADKERPNNNNDEFPQSASTIAGPTLGTLQRVADGDIGRTLPRELEFGDSDGKKEKTASVMIPRKEKAARMLANSGKTAADLLRSGVQRRNTCGTMYIRTTMSAPDKDATIRCVCGVYRSHIISSEHMNLSTEETESLNVFNDYPNDAHGMQNKKPTINEISTFYRDIFFKAQMEADCIIMSLIYVERLIKKTCGHLRPRATNWRSLLFSCMILSSKVWDDLSMWNADFSQSCPPGGVNFSLQRINQLELAILNTLKFNVKVPASEYAKYYFLLRSMLIKSGLGGEDLGSLNPLDVDGARRLQQVSSQFESMSLMNSPTSLAFQRSKSMAVNSDQNAKSFRQPKTKVGLEQVVKM